MDATAWVAIAGIGGTLLAPAVTERMRRRSARHERLLTERLVAYADLVHEMRRMVVALRATVAGQKTVDPDAVQIDHINRAISRADTVGTRDVVAATDRFFEAAEAVVSAMAAGRAVADVAPLVVELDRTRIDAHRAIRAELDDRNGWLAPRRP